MEKVIVSACLIGENCKYNGGNNKREKIIEYLKDKEVILRAFLRQAKLKALKCNFTNLSKGTKKIAYHSV